MNRVVILAIVTATAIVAAPAVAAAQLTLTSPLAITPTSPAPYQSTVATFTVRNSGTSSVTIPYFIAGARTSSGANVDFPASPSVTLAAGQSFTYRGTRTFSVEGSYTAWPSYYQGGSTWVNLASPSTFFVETSPAHLSVVTPLALTPSAPAIGQTTTASFTITNDGGSPITLQYLLVGARDPSGRNVDFPAVSAITLGAGSSYTYSGARTFATAGSYQAWPAASIDGAWSELSSRSTLTVGASTPAHLTITVPLAVSRATSAAGTTVTGSFVVKNDGGSAADVQTLLVGARDSSGTNIDLPPVGPLTLQPGATYSYQQSRTLSSTGSLTAWPAAFFGSDWIELGPRITVPAQSTGCALTAGNVEYGYLPPAQTVGGGSTTFTVPAGQVHQTAWAETGGEGAANINGAYAYDYQGWKSLAWRWADTMRHESIQQVTGADGSLGYRVELTPDDHASPGTAGDHPRAEFFSVDPAEDRRERTPPTANTLRAGDEYWATFAVCIPSDFPENHRWATLVQRKLDNVAAASTNTAWFTLNVHMNRVDIAVPGTVRSDYSYPQIGTLADFKNRWVQVTIHEKLSTGSDGVFELFVDGVRKASRIGQPTISDTSALYNFHYGYYRANEPDSSQTTGPGPGVLYYSPFMFYRGSQPAVIPSLK